MRSLELDDWDDGHLRVNRQFAPLLRAAGLTSYDALARLEGPVYRAVGRRVTMRIEITVEGSERSFFIKKHGPPRWLDYAKPLLHGTWPVLGARPEWEAMVRFHELGIPTMVPVALGCRGRSSLVVSQALEDTENLEDWLRRDPSVRQASPRQRRRWIDAVARIARHMHQSGIHHQDFYLCHFLKPRHETVEVFRLIDLGRVRMRRRLRSRWIVKDLAQLRYSARELSARDQLRFLRSYLERPLTAADRRVIVRIDRKAAAIARHSHKHGL